MAHAGVSYTVGREANSQYNETINGVELMTNHQLPDYVVPGDPKSGLIWGISENTLSPNGTGANKVQAYNFRIVLTDVPANSVPITKPDDYDPAKYELLLRLKEKSPWKSLTDVFNWSRMPNGKTDINNRGGFSTDMIGMSWKYPDADYNTREKLWKAHLDYTIGLLYFIGNDSRIPLNVREQMKRWGYPKDEFTDSHNWTPQLYIREARRMIGELVMTQDYCEGKKVATDIIGMAAYNMDSHNCDRLVVNGMAKNEGNVEAGGFGPYPISYRAIIPKQIEATNLFVPVCLSASHIAYGSIRMEPVFMVLAQSSAVAACLAINQHIPVQKVNVAQVQDILKTNPLADNSPPEVLVDNDDKQHVQIIGDWVSEKVGGFGPSYLINKSANDSSASVSFNPDIKKTGTYHIYAYFPQILNPSGKTHINIFDGQTVTAKTINQKDIKAEGQTTGEWISLDSYNLAAGNKAYVQILDQDANGRVTADAVLFVLPRQ
jgi:hypothetical protein